MPIFELALRDCVDWLSGIEDASVDCVVTDPAYQSLERHRATGTTTRLVADWFEIFKNDRIAGFLAELYRVLKKDTHCYIYCDQETSDVLHHTMFEYDSATTGDPFRHTKLAAERFPFAWKKRLIWMKSKAELDEHGEAVPAAGMGFSYRYSHECIVYLEKGKRRLNDLGMCDVIPAPRIRGGYPTEKNPEVTKKLILQSTQPGELVVDPFMGSGSTGDSAITTGRSFAGCDIAPRSINIAQARLVGVGGTEGHVLTKRLPPAQASLFV